MVKLKFNQNWAVGKAQYRKGDISDFPKMTARELTRVSGLVEVISGEPAKKPNALNHDDFKKNRISKKYNNGNRADILDGVLYMFGRPSLEVSNERKSELMENMMDVLKNMGIERATAFVVLFCNKKCKSWAEIEKNVSDMFIVVGDENKNKQEQ